MFVAEPKKAKRNINVHLSADLRDRLQAYMDAQGMSISQAVRVLLELALGDMGLRPEDVFKSASFREGVYQGVQAFKVRMQQAFAEAMADLDHSNNTKEMGAGQRQGMKF